MQHRRFLLLFLLYAVPMAVMLSGALVWLARDAIPNPRDLESGDPVRDAVVRAFDQAVFASPDQQRQRPMAWMWGRAVRVEFVAGEQPVPLPLRQLVEDIAAATHGRVSGADSGGGEIITRAARLEAGPCQIRREVWMGGVVRGDIVVDPTVPSTVVSGCYADSLLSMLGLAQRLSPGAATLSSRERVLLGLMFSPQLKPAMHQRGEVLAAVRREVESMPIAALCRDGQGFC